LFCTDSPLPKHYQKKKFAEKKRDIGDDFSFKSGALQLKVFVVKKQVLGILK
jgi:hypothetical protein